MKYFCCESNRRNAVDKSALNGIDFLEVSDDPNLPNEQRQRTLFVHFIKPLASGALISENIRIEGGERIRNVAVTDLIFGTGDQADVLTVKLDKAGDFSKYTLRLVPDSKDPHRLDGFDQLLRAADFSFKVNCFSDFDCQKKRICPPEPQSQPEINYLAKDYASFKQLMFDRMALLMPQWKERNPADVCIALVELLAYIGDYLSYQQDAIATEAYLATARSRISIRRHARLVDYFMHDGCNARAWVQVKVTDNLWLAKGTQLFTRIAGQGVLIPPDSYDQAIAQQPEVFETVHDALLFEAHNEMSFYTWGAQDCCLPRGATCATLRGHLPNLKAGDVIVFIEARSPKKDEPEDADPNRRYPVRLTHVVLSQDPLGGRFLEEPNNDPVDVTDIQWAAEDALPLPLCVGTTKDNNEVSIALGNIVLADHGSTIKKPEPFGSVPKPKLFIPAQDSEHCQRQVSVPVPPRFRPSLSKKPLTFAVIYEQKPLFGVDYNLQYKNDLDEKIFSQDIRRLFSNQEIIFWENMPSIQGSEIEWSISDGLLAYVIRKENDKLNVYKLPEAVNKVIQWTANDAMPSITLTSESGNGKATWQPRRDLINSNSNAPDFVVEIESEGTAYLRFGDDKNGHRPDTSTAFEATYRVGNGMQGNVGAGAIAHIVSNDHRIKEISNPLPAQGGTDPEGIEQVRQNAPNAFRTQQRAVTPEDYAKVAQRHPQVQRAAATFRWTGSWRTVFMTIDRLGGLPVDDVFKDEMRRHIERYRMAGHDLEIDAPRFVSMEIEMKVCVKTEYFRSDVEEALLQVFSNRTLPDGRRGAFHPDNFTFNQTVHLSQLYAQAQAIPGVAFVQITKFQRQGIDSDDAIKTGKLTMGRLEIARLDNDPNFPEHGVFRLNLEGGK